MSGLRSPERSSRDARFPSPAAVAGFVDARRGSAGAATRFVTSGNTADGLWPAVCWAAALLVWSSDPTAGFVLATTGVALVWRRWIPTHAAALAAAAAILLTWGVLGVGLSVVGVPVVTTWWSWAVVWLATVAVVTTAGGRLVRAFGVHRADDMPSRVRGWRRLLFLPSALFLVVGVVHGAVLDQVLRWTGHGTDVMVRLLLMQSMAREGALAYGLNDGTQAAEYQQAYPKLAHWVATASIQPVLGDGDTSSADAFRLYLQTFGGFIWVGIGLAALAAAGAVLAAADRWKGMEPAVGAIAIVVLTALMVGTLQFGETVISQGGLGPITAVVSCWVLWWAIIARARLRVLAVVVVAAVVIMANSWQPLVLIVAMTAAGTLFARRHAVRDAVARRGQVRGMWFVASVCLGVPLTVLGLLPITSLALTSGADVALIPGAIHAVHLPSLLATVAVGVWAAIRVVHWRGTTDVVLGVAGFLLGALVTWAGMAWTAHGVSAYYPLKVLWFVCVFSWPLMALGLGALTVRAWRRAHGVRRMCRGLWGRPWGRLLAGSAAVVVSAAGLPWALVYAPPTMAAMLSLDPPGIAVKVGLLDAPEDGHLVPFEVGPVWDHAGFVDKVAAQTLRFRFGEPWSPINRNISRCALLRMASPAVVVTSVAPAQVGRDLGRLGCDVAGYRVVQVS